jgi:hypothetical protein
MLGRQVPVAEGHGERVMAQQALHLLERCAPLDGPGREGVPQVVEVEVDQLRAPTARSQAVRKWSQRRVPKTRPALFEPRRLPRLVLVLSSRTTPVARSTRSQVSPSISPRRIPVKSANSTRSDRSTFLDSRQASSSRVASSGVSHRSRPRTRAPS